MRPEIEDIEMLGDVSRLKKLATLNVYLDSESDGSNGLSTSFQINCPVPGEWAIVLRPKADAVGMEQHDMLTGQPTTKHKITVKEGITIFCHELGHFVSTLFRHPSHHPLVEALGIVTPAEREAWRIAKIINPNIDYQMMDAALAGYNETHGPNEQRIMSMMTQEQQTEIKKKLNI